MREFFDRAAWRADLRAIASDPSMWLMALSVFLGAFSSFYAMRALGLFVPVALVLLFAVFLYRHRRIPPLPLQGLLIAGLFLLLVLWGAWRSVDPDFAFERVGKLALYSLIAVLFWALVQEIKGLGHLKRLALAGFGLGLAVCFVEGISDGYVYWIAKGVSRGEAMHATNRPVVLLALMLWPTLLCFNRERIAWGALALFGVTLTAALQTESQSAQLALIAGGVCLGLAAWKPEMTVWVVALGGAVLLLGLPFIFATLDASQTADLAIGDSMTVHSRLELWIFVADKIVQQPLVGYGLEIGRFMPLDDMVQNYFNAERMHHPHNGVLQLWFELGVVGASAAAVAWVYLVRRIGFLSGAVRAAALGCVTYAFTVSTVSHGLWQSWWVAALIWVPVLFVICSVPNISENHGSN